MIQSNSMFMISLAIIFGIFFTIFSVQNTSPVDLSFGGYSLNNLPLYAIILGSLLLGVVIAWIFALVDNVSSIFLLNSKEKTIRELKKTVTSLIRRVHSLEIETEDSVPENEAREL